MEGHQIMIIETLSELTPDDAAEFLNVSRMYVMKLVQEGVLPYRMVGNHHRIPYVGAVVYKTQQQARSRTAMNELYALNRDNPVEGPLPPRPEPVR
jgi:excisionase family DNA binding protein